MPHALLLSGKEGVGKMAIALELTQALLCETSQQQEDDQARELSCGVCKTCRMVQAVAHPDLHFVFPVIKPKGASKATSETWLKEWRTLLQTTHYFDLAQWGKMMGIENQQPIIYSDESDELMQKMSLVPAYGGYRVIILWLPELMHEAFANKMLKLIEEPPPKTLFLLLSNTPEKILPTIRSRTQLIEVPKIDTQELAQALQQLRGLDETEAKFVAHLAEGSYSRALQQLSASNEEREFFDMFVHLMRKCYQRDIHQMYNWTETVAAWGREKQKAFLEYAQRLVRENFILNFQLPELNYMNRHEAEFSTRFARFINERNVMQITEELSRAQRDITQNVNPKMVFFDFSLKMIVLLIQ